MTKTQKTILWVVVIAAVAYFGYKWYKKTYPTVGTGGLVTPVSGVTMGPRQEITPLV